MGSAIMRFGCVVFALLLLQSNAVKRVVVGVHHSDAGLKALTTFVDEVSDPLNPLYGHYLSYADTIAMIRPSIEEVDAAKQWMLGLGFCLQGTLREAHSHDTLSCDTVEATEDLHSMYRPLNIDFIVSVVSGRAQTGTTEAIQWSARAHTKRTSTAGQHGTPLSQRAFYGIPESERGINESNLQMVWGPGTFGANPLEINRFYKEYCTDCSPTCAVKAPGP